MPTISKRPAAHRDLAEIWRHVAENSSDIRADTLIDLFEAKARTLAKSPKIGRARPELMESLRSFAIGRYVLFYLPEENGVDIVRVLHGARDIDSLFADEDSLAE